MAMITNLTKCPICDKPIGEDMENVISFPADAIDALSDFWRFYDGSAHISCLKSWSRKEEFIDYWNSSINKQYSNEKPHLFLIVTSEGNVEFNKQRSTK